jgi:Na+-transporting NADH:ubiquinone oxidoreductase subunit NqrB
MTDEPGPEDPNRAEPPPKKGQGCFIGGLVTIGALIAAAVLGGILAGVIGGAAVLAVPLLGIGLLIGAAFYWREMPGFLLGMGLTIALGLAIGTACAAALTIVPA